MAVEHRLAVFDRFREPPGGDRVPAFSLGEISGRGDDPGVALGSLALAPIGDGHQLTLAVLEDLVTIDKRWQMI
jgi:hypothetical protein